MTSPATSRRHSGYDLQPDHWYVDPMWCTSELLRLQDFGPVIWDPACGSGSIPEACRGAGKRIIATDLVDRGYPGLYRTLDFVHDEIPAEWQGRADIVCNPPYNRARLATAFIERALQLTRRFVAVLVGESFLGSEERFLSFTEQWPVSLVLWASQRPSMPPGGMDVKPTGGQTNYVWIVFDILQPLGQWPRFWWMASADKVAELRQKDHQKTHQKTLLRGAVPA